ncbi:MAG: VWA domain-containing protein [Acidobacteria bacterium]|nr:VWA domain-containing protein [Acidobacteriota bacterium]
MSRLCTLCSALVTRVLPLIVLAVSWRSGIVNPVSVHAQANERDLYVSVLDAAGAPVKGLTASDFIVREDGVQREVLRARPATQPMTIALILDNTQAATTTINDLRNALKTFVNRMAAAHDIALIAFGDRPTVITEYTRDAALLQKGIGRIFAQPGSGSYLLEALIDTARGLRKREAERPVIVLVTTEGPEFSNQHYDMVLEPLRDSGAALHALVLTLTATPPMTDEARNRNVVLDRGTSLTGGRRDNLLSSLALRTKLEELARELSNQYVVTYGRPQALIPPEKIEVRATQPGLTARGTPVMPRKRP